MDSFRRAAACIFLAAAIFIASGRSSAADNSAIDNIIASTFKTLAKAFVVTADINRLKDENIAKIKLMPDEKFSRRYFKIYNIVKDYPGFCGRYGLNANMSAAEAIVKIESMDKEKLYAIIDSTPSDLIAGQFRLYLRERKEALQSNNIIRQIRQFWDKIAVKAYGKK